MELNQNIIQLLLSIYANCHHVNIHTLLSGCISVHGIHLMQYFKKQDYTERERERERERRGKTDRQTERQAYGQPERERERGRGGVRKTETDSEPSLRARER